eukprot:Hpha_TRINITY_DN11560_c0_g3::TRINITY_DN11560_c0_g3_i1::g.32200::m.32200
MSALLRSQRRCLSFLEIREVTRRHLKGIRSAQDAGDEEETKRLRQRMHDWGDDVVHWLSTGEDRRSKSQQRRQLRAVQPPPTSVRMPLRPGSAEGREPRGSGSGGRQQPSVLGVRSLPRGPSEGEEEEGEPSMVWSSKEMHASRRQS